MRHMTEANMIDAFGAETMAHMRYRLFARQADKEGYPTVARLFRAIAEAEFIHAADHFHEIRHLHAGLTANCFGEFGRASTAENLDLGIAGESYEIDEMYPAFMEVARLQQENSAARSFQWSYETEKSHRTLFQKAKEAVDQGGDVTLRAIRVCAVCGFTLEGDAPEQCPVCGAPRNKFMAFGT